jgi:hypothetical protein
MHAPSPLPIARLAGLFYLITALAGGFAELVVRGNLVVYSDAAQTARNILASQGFYRLGLVADILSGAAYAVVTVLLYELLKPVNARLSLLAAFFSLIGIAVGALAGLGHIAPLLLLTGAHYLSPFNAAQLQAMALLALKLHAQGFLICLVFFGLYEVMLGYLILRSTFFPRALGVVVGIGGLAFVTNSLTMFLSPAVGTALSMYMLILDGVGEISLMLWLLIMGVNVEKWQARSQITSAS